MDAVIKNICQALKEEAEAVIESTDRINEIVDTGKHGSVAAIFALNRLDRVSHIQNLTLELTNLLSGTQPPGEHKEA